LLIGRATITFMQCIRMPVRSYRDLIAWQKSIDFVTEIYRCTRTFPKEETYGLISQLRRAAVSVPSNIAEGHARLTTGEFRQFLGHALGSLTEIETQIQIANRLGYIGREDLNWLLAHSTEIGKVVRGLLQSLPGKESRRPVPKP
jgi:four helix bundle protein